MNKTKIIKPSLSLCLPLVILGLAACEPTGDGDADSDGDEFELDIAGEHVDEFGASHSIDDEMWLQTGDGYSNEFEILSFDNDDEFLIAQNGEDNGFFPSMYSRFDWLETDENIYYCQTTFDEETPEDAEATPAADPTDLLEGCADFGWTLLTP